MFVQPAEISNLEDIGQWWKFVPGANWRHPEGPGSDLESRQNHPVVQVAFEDAEAYASWAGRRCRAKNNGSSRRAAAATKTTLGQ